MLASDVMDQALIFLNDSGQSLYTYAVQLPYLKKASEDLEKELIANGIQVQRVVSSVISVAAGTVNLTLPSDFLLPIELRERNSGGNDDDWIEMREMVFEPLTEPGTSLDYWSFRDNKIFLRECSLDKEVSLKYARSLATIASQSSTIDINLSKGYLSARTAELCARYIGMNSTHANEIAIRDVEPAKENLIRGYVLAGQGSNRGRRRPFTTKRAEVY